MSAPQRVHHYTSAWRCALLALGFSCAASLIAQPASPPPAEEDQDEIIRPLAESRPDPAAEKFWAAVRLLQSRKPADLTAGRAALQAVADQEYTHGQLLLGNCLLTGSYGFSKEPRKAANLFRLAAERGNAFAKVSLGSCYATGTGVRKDDSKAVEWLTAALAPGADFSQPARPAPTPGADADTGTDVAGQLASDPVSESQAAAHYLLGQILARPSATAEAQAHFVAAATAGTDGHNGIYAAAVQAALNYAFGQGTARDRVKAAEMLEHSRRLTSRMSVTLIQNYVALKMVDEFAVADLEEFASAAGAQNESKLQVQIAAMLSDKKSKDYNIAEAVQWYELAAANGQVWAMLPLAFIHYQGDLGQPDAAKAFAWFEKAGGGDKPKHYLAAANLAICYQNGIGTAQDTAKAAALFQKHRDADIICYLGTIGQCPATPVTFEQEVKLNETWARQKNDPHAQYLLARRYLNGWGVSLDRDDGRKWLLKAAKAGHGAALCQLGLMEESTTSIFAGRVIVLDGKLEKAVDYYRRGSEAGNADATANYANMLQSGRGIARDQAKAEATYLKCLQQDPEHARGHCNLAVLYAQRLGECIDTTDSERIQKNRALMLKHYEESVRLQFAYAAQNLGNLYADGKLLPRDWAKAYRYYEQATEWGLPAVHYNLGYMHEHGQGVPVTYTEAAYHYRLAALEGHIEALRRLINFYLTGQGVSLDLDRAVFWLQRMVQLGNPNVLPTICDILIAKADYATVIPILRQLSDSPNVALAGYAYDRLAVCYTQGLGVKANPARASKYADQAVKRGNGDALAQLAMRQFTEGKNKEAVATLLQAAPRSRQASYSLGQMYYFGTHVEKDELKGVQFMRAAAAMNHSEALFFLAALTYNRATGAPALDQAIQYAQQAEAVGHPNAPLLREKLEQQRKQTNAAPEQSSRARSL